VGVCQEVSGEHAPKHVVVASPIASYIIKLVVVLTVVHLFTLYSHTTGMSNLEIFDLFLSGPMYISRLSSFSSFDFLMKGDVYIFEPNNIPLLLRAGRSGDRMPLGGGGRNFPHPAEPALGLTQPPIQWVPGHSPRVKRPGRGVNHQPSVPSWQVVT
jgi:hypothetical protein